MKRRCVPRLLALSERNDAMLNVEPNLAHPDETYARLVAAHEGLSDEESNALNARLVLILINHIGDEAVIAEALQIARDVGQSA